MSGFTVPSEDPVLCQECGSLFGAGADADVVCPYCEGRLHPLPAARAVIGPPDGGAPGVPE
ncbi:MAG: hypothetical protein U0Y82_01660 [Thermoleophilia bacterium]